MVPRALVIQSRPDVARAVSASLAEAEVHAIVLSDGHAVVAAIETWDPHVVLVDLTLPPLDGWCVLAAVGDLADHPLLVVRVRDESEVDRAIALGADAWVDNDVHVVAAAGRLALELAA
jgi:DNA-binding response OmpR family regulator